MSQIPNANTFAQAQVEVTADTAPLKRGLAEAKTDLESLGTAGANAGKITAAGMATAAAAAAVVGKAAYEAGIEIGKAFEQALSGGNISDFQATVKERVDFVQKEMQRLQEAARSTSLLTTLDDLISNGSSSGTFYSDRQKALKQYENFANELARVQARAQQVEDNKRDAKRQEQLQRDIENARTQSLRGAERIEAEFKQEADAARRKYKDDADAYIDALRVKKQAELVEFNERQERERQAQEKRQQQELDDIAERRDAYMNLIRKQELATIESNERIAKAAGEAMAREMGAAVRQFQAQSMSALGQLVVTMESLAASTEKLANQRRASGL